MSSTVYYAQNSYFKLGTYDMSATVSSITLTSNYDQLEITASGDSAHKYLRGLTSDVISGTLYLTQDAIAAGATRAVLDSLAGTSAAFEVGPGTNTVPATATTTNPIYKGTCFVNNFTPVNGAQGEVAMIDFSFDVTARTAASCPATA
jgi:hypothetical protein